MKNYKTNEYALDIFEKDIKRTKDMRDKIADECRQAHPDYALIAGGFRGTLDSLIRWSEYFLATMQEVSENECV